MPPRPSVLAYCLQHWRLYRPSPQLSTRRCSFIRSYSSLELHSGRNSYDCIRSRPTSASSKALYTTCNESLHNTRIQPKSAAARWCSNRRPDPNIRQQRLNPVTPVIASLHTTCVKQRCTRREINDIALSQRRREHQLQRNAVSTFSQDTRSLHKNWEIMHAHSVRRWRRRLARISLRQDIYNQGYPTTVQWAYQSSWRRQRRSAWSSRLAMEQSMDLKNRARVVRQRRENTLTVLNPPRPRGIPKLRYYAKPYSIERTSNSVPGTRPLLLTFDAFDTLFTPRDTIFKQYRDTAALHGIFMNEEEIYREFVAAWKYMTTRHPNYGKDHAGFSPRIWWSRLIWMIFRVKTPYRKKMVTRMGHRLYQRFSSSVGYRLYDDVYGLLEIIGASFRTDIWAPSRTMIGVISNSDPRVTGILESFGIPTKPLLYPPHFAPLNRNDIGAELGMASIAYTTFSYGCGFEKPAPEIFDAAVVDAQRVLDSQSHASRMNRTGSQYLTDINTQFHHMHVGDDLKKDVIPAYDRGWDAILLHRASKELVREMDIEGRRITVINSLAALPRLLTKARIEGTHDQRSTWRPVHIPTLEETLAQENTEDSHSKDGEGPESPKEEEGEERSDMEGAIKAGGG